MNNCKIEDLKIEESSTMRTGGVMHKYIRAMSGEDQMGEVNFSSCRLHFIFVDEDHRSKGIGSRLFKLAMEDLQDQGCDVIDILAFRDVAPFFKSLGAGPRSYYDEFPDGSPYMAMQFYPVRN